MVAGMMTMRTQWDASRPITPLWINIAEMPARRVPLRRLLSNPNGRRLRYENVTKRTLIRHVP